MIDTCYSFINYDCLYAADEDYITRYENNINAGTAKVIASISYPTNYIIDGYSLEKDGSVYVWGEKKGTATVTVKLSDGKTYKTTINLSAGEPNFYAVVNGYYTRDNYFTEKIQNNRRSD